MGGGHHTPRDYLKIHVSTDTGPITPWHGSGCCQCRGAGQGGGRKRRLRAPVLTACCISLSGSSACFPSRQSGWDGGGGQGYSIHVSSVSPRGSEALLSQTKLSTPPHPPQGPPRRDSVSRLETTVSRISPEDLRAGCQSDLGSAIVH